MEKELEVFFASSRTYLRGRKRYNNFDRIAKWKNDKDDVFTEACKCENVWSTRIEYGLRKGRIRALADKVNTLMRERLAGTVEGANLSHFMLEFAPQTRTVGRPFEGGEKIEVRRAATEHRT